ncbi:head maturation protease, ClpP-related [Tepidibacter thalassicus]|uniref:ATP-dependent protease ClpP, protease subunit n=1 Tax=Tepidibacter thalassicus DSM 15285 TaxID=1123350 RepID=A0A1M5NLX4_9FIRM|nr:head maturation protease, ClpP-related [Tepidibacter thalassicus]SHG90209.1 ATP-dependent protease ClpP, protease subunit [Tepidibacter thalassicus DSM 15285]
MQKKLIASKIAWNFTQANGDLTEILIYDVIADKQSYNWWTDEKGTEVTPILFKEELNKITTSKICVRINSGGGDVFAAEAIRTAIREKRQEGKKINCKIDGFCGSAAVGIAAACESIAISSSSYFMIHDPMVFAYGYYNISDFSKGQVMLEKIKQGIINAYAAKTGKDKKEISDLMTAETWYTGDEAVENGFCDELMFEEVENTIENVVNSAALDMQMYRNPPISLLNLCSPPHDSRDFSNKTPKQTKSKESENTMEIKTVDELKAAFPDLTKQIENAAAKEERERIKNIEEMAIDGYEGIVNNAKFENPIAAAEVAMKIVAEQKKQGANYLASRNADVVNSNINEVGNSSQEGVENNNGENPYDAAIDKLFPESK